MVIQRSSISAVYRLQRKSTGLIRTKRNGQYNNVTELRTSTILNGIVKNALSEAYIKIKMYNIFSGSFHCRNDQEKKKGDDISPLFFNVAFNIQLGKFN